MNRTARAGRCILNIGHERDCLFAVVASNPSKCNKLSPIMADAQRNKRIANRKKAATK